MRMVKDVNSAIRAGVKPGGVHIIPFIAMVIYTPPTALALLPITLISTVETGL